MTKKLIIIDDSSTQLNILKSLFANNGWDVCGVQNAKIAYEMIFDFAPDLIITDAIMPSMGGFSLIKLIRENENISKIPVIVYSVLNQQNAKFFVKEEYSEYFLQKEDNQQELLLMANKIIEKLPLSEEYKENIIKIGFKHVKISNTSNEQIENFSEEIENETEIISTEETEELKEEETKENEINLKQFCDFSYGDGIIFSKLLSFLKEKLLYELAVIDVYSYESNERKVYFDIKDIILSPILKNKILEKYGTKASVMYKKYAPNSTTIIQEGEFLSKLEFNFEYKKENIANFVIYSKEKAKWENKEKNDKIKEILYEFFKLRYVQRKSQTGKKEDFINKYFSFQNKFKEIKNKQEVYFGILQISNYYELSQTLDFEELDIINSKVAEKIINCLEENEQIYRNDEDEYDIVIFAKDEKQAKRKFEYIFEQTSKISLDIYNVKILIALCNCNINNQFNIKDAQKYTRETLEKANDSEKVIIYDTRK